MSSVVAAGGSDVRAGVALAAGVVAAGSACGGMHAPMTRAIPARSAPRVIARDTPRGASASRRAGLRGSSGAERGGGSR